MQNLNQERRMSYNDDAPEWETEKYESKHDHEPTLYCSVFDELGTDRKPYISAFSRRQARQKRSNIRSIRDHVLIRIF